MHKPGRHGLVPRLRSTCFFLDSHCHKSNVLCLVLTLPLLTSFLKFLTKQQRMGAVHITSLNPKFNESHVGLPPSSIQKMTGWVAVHCNVCTQEKRKNTESDWRHDPLEERRDRKPLLKELLTDKKHQSKRQKWRPQKHQIKLNMKGVLFFILRTKVREFILFLSEEWTEERERGGGGGQGKAIQQTHPSCHFLSKYLQSFRLLLDRVHNRSLVTQIFEVVWWSTLVVKPTVTTKFVSMTVSALCIIKSSTTSSHWALFLGRWSPFFFILCTR